MTMDLNSDTLLKRNQRILSWCDEYSQELGKDVAVLKRAHSIDATDDLRYALERQEQENRLLNIGVIGRVKSGKSSLLNALVFNGDNILPHAATPMTAALTTLTHADRFYAKVDFYSDEDRANLKKTSEDYVKFLERERENARKQLQQRNRNRPLASASGRHSEDQNTQADLDARVEKMVQRVAQENHVWAAAHDQWQRIVKANIGQAELEAKSTIGADSAKALAEQLKDFVGVDGRFMPLTKSVDIFLPLESLRDIRIIDTPGFNDPVQSREERTNALLKDCDVVLIVSPAGQFLSEQDVELMLRLTEKEGMRELAVVASQVDNQLYGSAKQSSLHETLEGITRELGQRLRSTLNRIKNENPETGETFKNLLEKGSDNVLHTSGVCHNLSVRFNQANDWNSNEKKVMENLQDHFPDFFDPKNPERCRTNLNALSNMIALHNVVDEARKRKDEIQLERRSNLIRTKLANIASFHKALLGLCHEKDQHLRNADINELKQRRKKLDSVMVVAKHELNIFLDECLSKLSVELREVLNKNLKDAKDAVEETSKSVTKEGREERSREKKGVFPWLARKFWGGGKETHQEKTLEVYANHIRDAIQVFITDVETGLYELSETSVRNFRRELGKGVTRIAREHLKDDLDSSLLIRSIASVTDEINIPEFDLDNVDLSKLETSKIRLKGNDAEEFLAHASAIMIDSRGKLSRKIALLSKAIMRDTSRTLGDDLFSDIKQRIVQFEQDVEYKMQALERLQRMIASLEAIEV